MAPSEVMENTYSPSFHLLPSGLINPNWTDTHLSLNLIGSGVVFHVPSFFSELKELDEKGLPRVYDRILVSDRRTGIRLAEVFKAELFESKLRRLASGFAKRYGDLLRYDVEDEIARFREYRPKLAGFAVDAVSFMRSAQEKNMNILVEGANKYRADLFGGLSKCACAAPLLGPPRQRP
ncbi:Adenylosuccinate synthetase [Metarhizium anisopliae]|nr:Adenylosuccinate synthetase [Metarhizium anisopliae]